MRLTNLKTNHENAKVKLLCIIIFAPWSSESWMSKVRNSEFKFPSVILRLYSDNSQFITIDIFHTFSITQNYIQFLLLIKFKSDQPLFMNSFMGCIIFILSISFLSYPSHFHSILFILSILFLSFQTHFHLNHLIFIPSFSSYPSNFHLIHLIFILSI